VKPSERIAGRVHSRLITDQGAALQLDPITLITLILTVVRLLVELWGLFGGTKGKRRLERLVSPKWSDFFWVRAARRSIRRKLRTLRPDDTEAEIDALMNALLVTLANSTEHDILAVRMEALA
jgi:hypothetical protein